MIRWLLVCVVITLILIGVYLEFVEREDKQRFSVDTGERHFGYELRDTRTEYSLPMDTTRIFAFRKLRDKQPSLPATLFERHQYSDQDRPWLFRPAENIDPENLANVAELLAKEINDLNVMQVNMTRLRFGLMYEKVEIYFPFDGFPVEWMVGDLFKQEEYRHVQLRPLDADGGARAKLQFNDYELFGVFSIGANEYTLKTVNELTVVYPAETSSIISGGAE